MTRGHDKIFDSLVQGLQPARTLLSPLTLTLLWWTMSWLLVVTIALLLAPLRPGALEHLLTVPQFTTEIVTGLIAGFLISLAAFRLSVPGLSDRWLLPITIIFFGAWVFAYVIGLEYPALAAGMLGKRPHCSVQILVLSGPALLTAAWLFGRRYTIRSIRAGLFVGVAAAAMPALFMQLGCMYEPVHILKYHIAPIILVAITGAILFYFLLRLRRRW